MGAGQTLLANRAYDSDALRDTLTACGAVANSRPMPTQRRFPAFDAVLYSRRNRVERFFSKIKHFRAVATRYDKRNDTFLASIQLGALRIWLRTCEPVT
ncbi:MULTISPECIES: transposase [unclassified Shinella]|uniref:transposase n=1 Tax=unclassified Shinella TaxID=2643062 RepID=UPI00345BD1CC